MLYRNIIFVNIRRQYSLKRKVYFASGQQMDHSLKVPPVDLHAQFMDEVQRNVMAKVVRESLHEAQSSNDATEEVQIGK